MAMRYGLIATHTHMHRLVLEDLTWVEKEDLRSKSNQKALDVV